MSLSFWLWAHIKSVVAKKVAIKNNVFFMAVWFWCKKEWESDCKRSSVLQNHQICNVRHLSGLIVANQFYRATLWREQSSWTDSPQPSVYMHFHPSPCTCHTSLYGIVSSYLTFSPLPAKKKAVIFFYITAFSRILPVRKRSVLWCPDFPLA